MDNKFLQIFAAWVVPLYFTISGFMTFYFWYLYAQEESFMKTLFIGPIVSMLKGLFWIFYI
jgi:surface polysaccharide O-acyltransferase-like enzyme